MYLQSQLVDGILFSFERDILSKQRTDFIVIRQGVAVTDAIHKADLFLFRIMFIMHHTLAHRRRAHTLDTGNGRGGHDDGVEEGATVLFQMTSFLVVHPVVDGGFWRMFLGDQDLSFLPRRVYQRSLVGHVPLVLFLSFDLLVAIPPLVDRTRIGGGFF